MNIISLCRRYSKDVDVGEFGNFTHEVGGGYVAFERIPPKENEE